MFRRVSELQVSNEIIYFDGNNYNNGVIDLVDETSKSIYFIDDVIIEYTKDMTFWVISEKPAKKYGAHIIVGDDILYKGNWYTVNELGYNLQEYGIIEVTVKSEKKFIIYFDIEYEVRNRY